MNNLYFKLASNSILNAIGNYTLYIENEKEYGFLARIEGDGATILTIVDGVKDSSITIDISTPNSTFKVVIYDLSGFVFDTITLNSGEPSQYFKVSDAPIFSYQAQELAIPYQIEGLQKGDIEFEFNTQTKLRNNVGFRFETAKTFDVYYEEGAVLTLQGSTDGRTYTNIDRNIIVPTYNFYHYLQSNSFTYPYLRFSFADPTQFQYCGYSTEENAFILSVDNDFGNDCIWVEVPRNTGGYSRQTTLTVKCGSFVQTLDITQDENPDGLYFEYDKSLIPYVKNYTKAETYILPIQLNEGYDFEIVDYETHIASGSPYHIQSIFKEENNIVITTTASPTELLNRLEEQTLSINILIWKGQKTQYSVFSQTVNLKYSASGILYGDGEIFIDGNKNITGKIVLKENNAISMRVTSKPSWVNSGDILFDRFSNTILTQSAQDNTTDLTREGNVFLSFTRQSGNNYSFSFKITQAPTTNSIEIHKTFEDVLIEKTGDRTDILDIYTGNKNIYSGLYNYMVNITEFARYLFNDKVNIFESKYTDLNLSKDITYTINGSNENTLKYVYDYSNDLENKHNITELRQPINYYDERQYIFQSVFKYKSNYESGNIIAMGVNDFTFENMQDWHKYNVTFDASSTPSFQLNWTIFNGIQPFVYYGQKYNSKCTNAKFALYYMNIYGGWNWMLWESNKQIVKHTNSFNYAMDNMGQDFAYKVETMQSYDLTSHYLTDEGSKRLQDLYISPIVYLHDLESGKLIRVNIDTKSYQEKTFKNQGRKFFTQSITVKEAKNKVIY